MISLHEINIDIQLADTDGQLFVGIDNAIDGCVENIKS